MAAKPEQMIATQKAYFETLIAAQNSVLNTFERLADLNLKATRAAYEEVTERAQGVFELKDAQQAISALTSSIAQPQNDKASAYGKQVYEILTGLQTELSGLAEGHVAEQQKAVTESFEAMAKNAPAGSESAVALLKSTVASANTAFDSMTKAARQAAEAAESNLNAVTGKSKRSSKK